MEERRFEVGMTTGDTISSISNKTTIFIPIFL